MSFSLGFLVDQLVPRRSSPRVFGLCKLDSMVWGRVKIHRQGYEGGSRQDFGDYDQNFCVKFSKINNAHVNEQLSGNCNPTQRTIGN